MGMGGSIPFIAEFAAAFPTGGDPGHRRGGSRRHRRTASTRSLHLGVLERAATAEALLLANLA